MTDNRMTADQTAVNTRHRETSFGVTRCPNCHPRAEDPS